MRQYKPFRPLEEMENWEEVTMELFGFYMPVGRWIYQEGDENDQQVYFVIQGEAAKCNDGKSAWMR